MADVVSPREVTYNVTCHQWLRNGLSSILTLPTICVHRCRVWQVSLHASKGSAGQRSARSPCCVLLVLSMCCSSWLSLCSIAAHYEGRHDPRLAAWSAVSKASCSQEPRYKTPLMKNVGGALHSTAFATLHIFLDAGK